MKDQKTLVTILDNGNITAKVTDIYENPINNYDWVLQNMSPETVEKLIAGLQKGLTISKQLTSQKDE